MSVSVFGFKVTDKNASYRGPPVIGMAWQKGINIKFNMYRYGKIKSTTKPCQLPTTTKTRRI